MGLKPPGSNPSAPHLGEPTVLTALSRFLLFFYESPSIMNPPCKNFMFNSSNKKTTQHIHHINHRSTIPTAGFSVFFLIFSLKTRRDIDFLWTAVARASLRVASEAEVVASPILAQKKKKISGLMNIQYLHVLQRVYYIHNMYLYLIIYII